MTATSVRATFASTTFVMTLLALALPLAPARAADLYGDRYSPDPYAAEPYARGFYGAESYVDDDGYDDEGPPPPGRYGPDRYDEAPPGRYADRGFQSDRAFPANRYADKGYPGGYSEGYGPPNDAPTRPGSIATRPGSIKDGYPVPMPPTGTDGRGWDDVKRFNPPPPRFACLERWQVRQELRRRGWTDIRPMGGDGRIVHVRARRFDSSSVFSLKVERCSGEVLAARPFYLRSFAYGERPWRY